MDFTQQDNERLETTKLLPEEAIQMGLLPASFVKLNSHDYSEEVGNRFWLIDEDDKSRLIDLYVHNLFVVLMKLSQQEVLSSRNFPPNLGQY